MTGPGIIVNVDDTEHGRYAKGRILSHAGFLIHDAATGSEALALVERHKPDLVLLDVNLPDMNGLEVCRRLKARPSGEAIIVLQISATALATTQATALDNGADAYLREPVEPEVLVATVKALLRLRRAERELSGAKERLQNLNQELRRSNEDLQQFAFAASHDLQEPLRTIASFASILQKTARPKLDEKERECLEYIADGSRRMRTLIDDLLQYSQVGQKPATLEDVDLNAVVPAVLANLRESISSSGADITYDSLPHVGGDHAQLSQVLQNLISNSVKYARVGVRPAIYLSSEAYGDKWLICVRDNGMGIESPYLETVFDPFKRLHGKEIPGTGLGLAICRRVIEAHGGSIWAESKEAAGATFCFTLPAGCEQSVASS